MSDDESFQLLPEPLRAALTARGYTALTPVQMAVSDPSLAGQNLRISSQTGSGKTVAIGIALAKHLMDEGRSKTGPAALIIVPTRELAAQVRGELSWLFAPLRVEVTAVTGGTGVLGERRALARNPAVIVGTPGRTLDHLSRGAFAADSIKAVVLDEADQMLDLGFREELEAILGALPPARSTHLVSATFPEGVMALAERYQGEHVHVEGTPLGDVNADISHTVHLVQGNEREGALTNLLLLRPTDKTLVFVRTRADTAQLAQSLSSRGFSVAALTGDMEQRERARTLDGFRSGRTRTLVATDVAARGLDVADVARVVHYDPPEQAETYTHRSGRTGRAGNKGASILLAPVFARGRILRLLREARIEARWSPPPTPDDVRRGETERTLAEARAALAAADAAPGSEASPASAVSLSLAEALLKEHPPLPLVAWLLQRVPTASSCEPVELTPVQPRNKPEPAARPDRAPPRGDREPRSPAGATYELFEVNWGERDGATPQRLTAMLCRRGRVRSTDLGAIEIGRTSARFEVSVQTAAAFASAVRAPDRRDPHIRVRRVEKVALERPDGPARRTAPPDLAPPPELTPRALDWDAPADAPPRKNWDAPADAPPRKNWDAPADAPPRKGWDAPADAPPRKKFIKGTKPARPFKKKT